MMAAALDNWLRTEMELQPPAVPPPAVLRRLCSGPGAPVWEFIIRHVKNSRNVKKIRGNLLWYQQKLEAAVSPPDRQEALQEAVSRMRAEVRRMDQALGGAQEAALRLEELLRAGQSRLWVEHRRGAELRLLGAELAPEGLQGLQGALRVPRDRPHRTRAELSATMAMGAEPEVLTSIRSLCMSREGEEFLEPHPPNRDSQELRKDWLEKAEAELGQHHPEEVLWALEALTNDSMRMLRASPTPSPDAPLTTKELIQECWMLVGGVWGSLPPLIFQLNHLQQNLNELVPKLGGDPKIRLALTRVYLEGVRGSLTRRVQELRGGLEDPQPPTPGVLRQRLQRGRRRVLQRQRRLRLLSAATRGRQALLRLLQGQVRLAAGAGPGSAPPLLEREGRHRRLLLGALGALGEPLPHPGPSPLDSLRRNLGLGPEQRLRLVSDKCQECLEGWPRLLDTVSQWWDLPAQHIQATPPDRIPFSHWLERWRGAVLALTTPIPEVGEEPVEPHP
ncbi:HAUS augmin-like complex subunit 5 isoform X2 [Chiroxiphia lanceolata]|uniref:HAUS augmin-like complex subunit 5 isoform X2 n=1 Tax=Chiroxiphia lanceolata TaxID=296741 RepID=UPI0013CEDEE5|nr:HAUS augmin-like complex subunit 5 isoform X2 [Chiroxiphia lanceolata]